MQLINICIANGVVVAVVPPEILSNVYCFPQYYYYGLLLWLLLFSVASMLILYSVEQNTQVLCFQRIKVCI